LTGAFAPSGIKTNLGVLMAQEYFNTVKGGVFVKELNRRLPLRVIAYDDRSEPPRAKSFAERLIEADKVHALVAPFGSALTIGIAPVAEAKGVPMVAPAAWSDAIYNKGYKYTFNPYILASDEGRVAIDLFHDMNRRLADKWNTLALLYSEDPYATTVAVGVRDRVKKYNYRIVLDQGVPRGTLDFGPLILKMKDLKPDLVFYMDNSVPANVKMVQQMRELGFNTKLLYFPVLTDNADVVMEQIKDIAEGLTGHTHSANHVFSGQEELWKWLVREAEAKGYPVRIWPGLASTIISGFLCVQLLVDAIERAGSLDTVRIRDALAKTDGLYLSGPIRFGPNGVNDKYTLILVQLQKGDWVTISPEKIDGIDLRAKAVLYPKPAWR
jgi:branched-chain amino acid transport system substrate-binding protein